jgi:hypothetical protein
VESRLSHARFRDRNRGPANRVRVFLSLTGLPIHLQLAEFATADGGTRHHCNGDDYAHYLREFDLSVGAIYAVTGVVTGLLAKHFKLEIWEAAICGLASALILGLLNGLLVTTTKINSFIATLSTMMVYRGIAMVLSQGQPISSFQFETAFFDIMGRGKGFGAYRFLYFGWRHGEYCFFCSCIELPLV